MQEESSQRVYLTCGSVFLLIFCFAAALSIVSAGPGDNSALTAVIALTVSIAVLLLNSRMLFGSDCQAVRPKRT